jgi:hypothetical protein
VKNKIQKDMACLLLTPTSCYCFLAPQARPYAEKAKWKDPGLPCRWLTELFDKYVPPTILEMKKAYNHITPLATMNFVTTLVNILEGCLKPENLSNKSDQVGSRRCVYDRYRSATTHCSCRTQCGSKRSLWDRLVLTWHSTSAAPEVLVYAPFPQAAYCWPAVDLGAVPPCDPWLQAMFEMYFVFALIWAFGGALCEKDGINYRRNFDKWFKVGRDKHRLSLAALFQLTYSST